MAVHSCRRERRADPTRAHPLRPASGMRPFTPQGRQAASERSTRTPAPLYTAPRGPRRQRPRRQPPGPAPRHACRAPSFHAHPASVPWSWRRAQHGEIPGCSYTLRAAQFLTHFAGATQLAATTLPRCCTNARALYDHWSSTAACTPLLPHVSLGPRPAGAAPSLAHPADAQTGDLQHDHYEQHHA